MAGILASKMQIQGEMVHVVSVQRKARTFADYLLGNAEKSDHISQFNLIKKRGKKR